jgi:hypothetical protein
MAGGLGAPVSELCRQHGIPEQNYCWWKKLYGLGNKVSQTLSLECPVSGRGTVPIKFEQKQPN